jgi:hypothetical protein
MQTFRVGNYSMSYSAQVGYSNAPKDWNRLEKLVMDKHTLWYRCLIMIEIFLFNVNFCQLRQPCCKFDCKTSVRSFENSHANADIGKCLEGVVRGFRKFFEIVIFCQLHQLTIL